MKKSYLIITALLFISKLAHAQWTTAGNDIWNSNAGKVGIGTTNPVGKLTVKTVGTSLEFDTDVSIGYILSYDRTNSLYKKLGFRGSNFGFLVNDIEKVTIDGNGNVGIGTINPASNLTIRASGTGVSIHSGGGGYYGSIAFNRESATGTIFNSTGNAFQINNGGLDRNLHIQVYNGSGVQITGDALVIDGSNGNIGIGTATPDTKLAVNGAIHTKEVKVDLTGWPDYVFKKDYQLPSLQEVKTYIDQNQHLPEIPSEQEITKNGLKLGEMNKLLVKKVEELTLYLIEKDKENRQQREDIEELKAQMKKLLKQ